MGYLLEIARKVQTPQRESYPIKNELYELNELTSSAVAEDLPFTEKSIQPLKVHPTSTEKTQLPANMNAAWSPDIQSLVDWFITLDPPKEPFHLEGHQHIVDPAKFFRSLRREIETGPRGPRARMESLQSDLQRLKAFFSGEGKTG